jgi:hypothetical protein
MMPHMLIRRGAVTCTAPNEANGGSASPANCTRRHLTRCVAVAPGESVRDDHFVLQRDTPHAHSHIHRRSLAGSGWLLLPTPPSSTTVVVRVDVIGSKMSAWPRLATAHTRTITRVRKCQHTHTHTARAHTQSQHAPGHSPALATRSHSITSPLGDAGCIVPVGPGDTDRGDELGEARIIVDVLAVVIAGAAVTAAARAGALLDLLAMSLTLMLNSARWLRCALAASSAASTRIAGSPGGGCGNGVDARTGAAAGAAVVVSALEPGAAGVYTSQHTVVTVTHNAPLSLT